MVDLNEMLVFTKVVQSGSFTAASKLLALPKSSVSRKVAALEDRIGARLLQRTTRKLGLTDVGRIYYEAGLRVVAEAEEAELAVGRMRGEPCGRLRVTAPLSFTILAPIVAELLRRHPAISVDMVCTDRIVDLVGEGFDVAVRAGQLHDSALIVRSLGSIRRVLVASPQYLRTHPPIRTPSDLLHHDCISFGVGPTPDLWQIGEGDKAKSVAVSSRFCVNDVDMMLTACRAGVGIASIPDFVCAADLRSKKLKRVLPSHHSTRTPVHAVYPSTRHLSLKVTSFVSLLRDRFSMGERR